MPYDRTLHQKVGFDCGVPSLNDWLATAWSQFEKRDLSRTYVLLETGTTLVRGYYAISSHCVVFDSLPINLAKGLPPISIPVVLIGRLAVDRSVRGQGLGQFLLIDALQRIVRLSQSLGIRAVEVDAIDDTARNFYLKYGFIALNDDPNHLFLPLNVIRKLPLPPG